MSVVTQNPNRLNHLLSLFRLSKVDLLTLLSEGLVNPISEEDVFSEYIKLSTLKKIDKIFNKGLSYYIDPSPVVSSKGESIFFRKDSFNAPLKLSDIQLVNKFEEKKIYFESLLKLSDIRKKRVIKKYSISHNAADVAREIRKLIYPQGNFIGKAKDFLRALISNLADQHILVFEYVEARNKKEKVNINGFYLSPDVIVLKWQKHIKREIFTLVHEVGHYLLDEEEIDDNIYTESLNQKQSLSDIENWCNEFAFSFLIGQYNIDNFEFANVENDFHSNTLNEISQITFLSRLSLYTRLLLKDKISEKSYNAISLSIKEFLQKEDDDEKLLLELNRIKAESKGQKLIIPPVPPIISPFYLQTLQVALSNGVLNEYEFCTTLNIKPEKIDAYLV
jgi:Zn-dependent peptidase ImmA (M78 family)